MALVSSCLIKFRAIYLKENLQEASAVMKVSTCPSEVVLKFARLHSHTVLGPLVRVHGKLIIVGGVGERVDMRLFVRRLRESGQVVLVGELCDL